jgi:hypothetical protein
MLNQILSGGQFANAADQQRINSLLQTLGFNNAAEAQQFADALASGTFANENRAAALGEEAFARSLPFQEAMSLYGLTSPQAPAFTAGGGGAPGVQPTDILGATQAQYGNALDLYNSRVAQRGSARGGLLGLAGTIGGAVLGGPIGGAIGGKLFSDRRLKSEIEQIGHIRESFLPVYRYEMFGEPHVGVMADEVRLVHPEAVARDPASGYDMVDYSKIPGITDVELY